MECYVHIPRETIAVLAFIGNGIISLKIVWRKQEYDM
jgi:hypothetical protein